MLVSSEECSLITRIFHPVGQGAFYSERHKNFNIVYDCGNWKNTKAADRVVKQAFHKNEVIDILFISHFDWDHVNKIKILKEHTQIKKVIMPLLHDEEKFLLINLYRALNFDIVTLIENPQVFFGNKTQIITIEPSESNEEPIGDNIEPIDLDDLSNRQISLIPSGTLLTKRIGKYYWAFIPYNYQYPKRHKELMSLLEECGFDIEKLKKNPKYTIETTIYKRKKIKDIYKKVSGNINQNSMLLYSRINRINSNCEMTKLCFSRSKYCHATLCCVHCLPEPHRVSCIYTGDTDLNIVKIKSIFKNFWESVGTIQIPHHGDIKNFDKSVLDDKYYLCPISVGEKNSYGHPSFKLIAEILSKDSYPILVTETATSGFIEVIRC